MDCTPKDQTTVLHAPLTCGHPSAISAITIDEAMLMMVQNHAYRSPEVVRFLNHLLNHVGEMLRLEPCAEVSNTN